MNGKDGAAAEIKLAAEKTREEVIAEVVSDFGLKKASDIKTDDGFWDISSLVPDSVKRAVPAPARKLWRTDSDDNHDNAVRPTLSPEKVQTYAEDEQNVIEYDGDGAIVKVRIIPWSTRFSFYSRFASQAEKLWRRRGAKADHVSFFSYMPQYEQMTSAQLRYYFYFRDRVRHGEYPVADCSYVLLYLYEIINVPHLVKPAVGAKLMALVWAAYRSRYPYLDRYAGEWLRDYVLVNRAPVPHDVIASLPHEALSEVPLFEVLFSGGAEQTEKFIESCSSYDFRKSKYYPSYKEEFETHIKKSAMLGATEYFSGDMFGKLPVAHATLESYSGAVACRDVKYRIEVEYHTASSTRKQGTGNAVSGIYKYCENQLRASLGIKSRFKTDDPQENVKRVIDAYFDSVYPDRFAKKKKQDDDDADYMRLYEPESVGEADISRAAKIEKDAWQTAIDLECELYSEEEAEQEAPVPESVTGGGFDAFVGSLDESLRVILHAALSYGFAAECAAQKIIPAEAERRINELAYDVIGDEVLCGGKIIFDYYEDINNVFNENGGNFG
ncbi:MAG: TerB N-terminal domain-containing protein [Clostridiales bacterium]|nr:TerB N-terminal domain-containing protein [Clostridiales bacterium]